jgi:transcriptional regulator with XRE-family HTH domain
MPYSALLGQLIKHSRVAHNIDQSAMAAALGFSQSAYSRIESGDTNMNVWQLRACAEQLGTTPSRLLAQVEVHERQLAAQGVTVVAEKRSNPAAALIGIAILAALLSR